jgi:hypothetical protein
MIFWDIFGRLQAFFALQNHWGESLYNRRLLGLPWYLRNLELSWFVFISANKYSRITVVLHKRCNAWENNACIWNQRDS